MQMVYLQCSLHSGWNAVLQKFTVYGLVESLVRVKYKETEINFNKFLIHSQSSIRHLSKEIVTE